MRVSHRMIPSLAMAVLTSVLLQPYASVHAQQTQIKAQASVASQASAAPEARIAPATRYSVTVRRSIGGDNGFGELIPKVSAQDILLETGSATGGVFTATLTVGRFHNPSEKGDGDDAVDFKASFEVQADGSITKATSIKTEGPMPPALVQSILMKRLRSILFITAHPLAGDASQVGVASVAPRAAQTSGGRTSGTAEAAGAAVEVKYTVTPVINERVTDATSSTSITGSAVFSSAVHFYTERSEKEVTTTYLVDDDTGETRTMRMDRTTNWTVVVEKL